MKSSSTICRSGSAASQSRVAGRDPAARVHSIAGRASGLNHSISAPPTAAASWLPRTPIAPSRRAGRRPRRARGRSRRRRRGARRRRPSRRGRGPRRGRRGCCGCPTGPRSAWTVSVAARCSPRPPCPRRGIARVRRGCRTRRGHHDQRVALPAGAGRWAGTRAGRRRGRPGPAGAAPARRRGRRASRRPGRRPARAAGRPARRGRPGRRPHARSRTASAAMGRVAGEGLGPDGGDGDRRGRRPVVVARRGDRGDRRLEEAGLLGDRIRRAAPAAPAARPPAAGRESRRPTRGRANASIPRERRTGTAVRLSTTCATATSPGSRIAVRLIATVQASSSRTWPSIAVALPGGQDQAERLEPGAEGVVVRGGEWWETLDARRERLTRGLQGTPPVFTCRSSRAAPLPASIVSHHERGPVFGRPSGSWPGLPEPLADRVTRVCPSADAGRYAGRAPRVNGVIHELPAGAGNGG